MKLWITSLVYAIVGDNIVDLRILLVVDSVADLAVV